MKYISFDVGIKNMAYCVFDCSGSKESPHIVDWNILNLMDKEDEFFCSALTKSGKICNKKGKYSKDNDIFCQTHAKKSGYLFPCSPCVFRKLKKIELSAIVEKYIPDRKNESRDILLQLVIEYYENNSMKQIKKGKKTASNTYLMTIGKNIKSQCDNKESMRTLDNVIIENQISPIANRMKTIQGMLMQYFIMSYENINIETLSSSGKLKGFEKMNTDLSSEYKQHKKDAIFYCNKYLEKDLYKSWTHFFREHNKKDDLADCFLQGIWYFNNKLNK